MSKRFVANKYAIIMTIIVIIYGLFSLYTRSNGWDFSKSGIGYFLSEMQVYFAAVGAIWMSFLLSVDRARKEIEKELKDDFNERLEKWGAILINDSYDFINDTLVSTIKPLRRHLPKIIKQNIPNKQKYVCKYYLNVCDLDKQIADFDKKIHDTLTKAAEENG